MTGRRRSRIQAALAVAIIAGIAVYWAAPFRNAPPESLPPIDLASAHPHVAQAVTQAREGVCAHPKSAAHWGHLAMVLMAHLWPGEARLCLQEAQRLDPDDFQWKYLEAVLLEDADFAAAAEAYEAAVRLKPDYPAARYRWGRLLIRLDRLDEAARQFRTVAELSPESPEPHIGLGRIAVSNGEHVEARAHFQRAVAVSQWNKAAHLELARVHHLLGEIEAARQEQDLAARLPDVTSEMDDPILQKVASREATSRQLAEDADALAARGDLRGAEAAFRKMICERPELSRPRLNLANVLASQGRFDEAIKLVRETIEASPSEALAHYQLGLLYESTGQSDLAIESYRAAINSKPDYAQAHFALGLLLQKAGKDESAREAYQHAVNADPQLAQAQLALGVLLQKAGELERAIVHMEHAARLVPGDPIPRKYLEAARQRLNEQPTQGASQECQ